MKKRLTLTQFSSLGGFGRAKKLSKKRRREIASKAGRARVAQMRRRQKVAHGKRLRKGTR